MPLASRGAGCYVPPAMYQAKYIGKPTTLGGHGDVKKGSILHLSVEEVRYLERNPNPDIIVMERRKKKGGRVSVFPGEAEAFDMRSVRWNSLRLERFISTRKKGTLNKIAAAFRELGVQIQGVGDMRTRKAVTEDILEAADVLGWRDAEDSVLQTLQSSPEEPEPEEGLEEEREEELAETPGQMGAKEAPAPDYPDAEKKIPAVKTPVEADGDAVEEGLAEPEKEAELEETLDEKVERKLKEKENGESEGKEDPEKKNPRKRPAAKKRGRRRGGK